MSRIDQAIEKAAKLRENSSPRVVEPIIVPAPAVSLQGPPEMDRLLDVDPIPVKNPFLVGLGTRDPAVCEEYKKLKSMVIRLTKGKEFKNSLLVTSSLSGEGKTLTAINLAITLAKEYDHTVLLVDADLRRPSIHEYLGIRPEVGLVDCLSGRASLEDALIKTGIGKLVVLPAGGSIQDPVEMLSSNRMKQILQELKSRYPERYVIFDTPPLQLFAEGQVLASQVDGVIFVVRERLAKTAQVKESLERIRETTNLLGVVFNDSSVRPKSKGYYYY